MNNSTKGLTTEDVVKMNKKYFKKQKDKKVTDIITKDEIGGYLCELIYSSLGLVDIGNCLEQPHRYIQKNIIEDYANKIISKINEKTGNNDFRVIAKGKVTQVNCYYEDGALIGGEGVTDLLGPYENKNIELGIRKVK